MPISKNLYHIEGGQLICKADQSFGFYMIQIFIERHFPTDYDQTERSFIVLAY